MSKANANAKKKKIQVVGSVWVNVFFEERWRVMQLVMCDNDTRMVKCGEGKRADYLYLGALVMILLSLVCLDLGFLVSFFLH